MIVALFGVLCVGKTTIGKLIADELQYEFYDLDAEMKLYYNDTILGIQKGCFGDGYDRKKVQVLKHILNKCSNNTVIAMSPIYYTYLYKKPLRDKNVVSIVLQDTPENIVNRLIYTDNNDIIIESLIRNPKEELRDVKYFISRYKKAFERIEHKYDIAGKDAATAAYDIIETIIKPYIIA